jgi:hypothetical protein
VRLPDEWACPTAGVSVSCADLIEAEESSDCVQDTFLERLRRFSAGSSSPQCWERDQPNLGSLFKSFYRRHLSLSMVRGSHRYDECMRLTRGVSAAWRKLHQNPGNQLDSSGRPDGHAPRTDSDRGDLSTGPQRLTPPRVHCAADAVLSPAIDIGGRRSLASSGRERCHSRGIVRGMMSEKGVR